MCEVVSLVRGCEHMQALNFNMTINNKFRKRSAGTLFQMQPRF